jgi:hypothetical protein
MQIIINTSSTVKSCARSFSITNDERLGFPVDLAERKHPITPAATSVSLPKRWVSYIICPTLGYTQYIINIIMSPHYKTPYTIPIAREPLGLCSEIIGEIETCPDILWQDATSLVGEVVRLTLALRIREAECLPVDFDWIDDCGKCGHLSPSLDFGGAYRPHYDLEIEREGSKHGKTSWTGSHPWRVAIFHGLSPRSI